MDSILTSVKKKCGIVPEYTHFDDVLVDHINTILATLYQLGVGPSTGFAISGSNETWEDFLGNDPRLSMVKSYVGLRVRMLFDPPTAGPVIDATNREIDELTWRINVMVDTHMMD